MITIKEIEEDEASLVSLVKGFRLELARLNQTSRQATWGRKIVHLGTS